MTFDGEHDTRTSIFTGRRIIAMDGTEPEAFAVRGGRIAATGAVAELSDRYPRATTVDLPGALVCPGFNDAHCHTSQAALQRVRVDVGGAASVEQLVRLLARRARHTSQGRWVVGQDFDEHTVDARVDRHTLDRVSADHPVLLIEHTFHRAVVNSAGLRALGYERTDDAPRGGQLLAGSDGSPDGWLLERAWLDPWLPGTDRTSIADPGAIDDQLSALDEVHEQLHALGITSYCDAIVTPVEEALYGAALDAGRLTARVGMLRWHSYADPNQRAARADDTDAGDKLRVVGIKMMLDGALSGGTCLCHDPYPSATGRDNGLQILDDHEFAGRFGEFHDAGWRVAVHANGDAAVAKVLDRIEQLPPRGARHRIEHCSVVSPELLRRMRRSGVIPVPFGPFVGLFGDRLLELYGPERAELICAHRSMLEAGLPVGGSSDYPIVSNDPLLAVQSMVTRRSGSGALVGGSQRLDPLTALSVYTRGSAAATGEQGRKGQLAVGQLADFVALEEDVTSVEPERIGLVRVLSTWVGGECVWRAPSHV